MLENREGQTVPDVVFHTRENGEWKDRTTHDLFAGKKIVLFALPGAFTPTCSSTHLPRYEELAGVFAEQGVDRIICLSVNDPFVMEAWAKDQGVQNIYLLADGNGEFSQKMGLLVDKKDLGFGARSWRYSMFVEDKVIKKMFIEPEKPGDPFKVSDADTMLNYLNPNAKLPAEVTIFSKPGCPFCAEAKSLLGQKGLHYEEVTLASGISYKTLRNVTGKSTAPQVFIDGKAIGGLTELKAYFVAR